MSYDYIASTLADHDARLPSQRVIVAHLGNGSSLCALKAGVSIATTMGFSALDGLPMGTRCGAIDPAVVFYMLRTMKLSPEEAERVLYTKSGLLGVSGLSNDMRTLRAAAETNPRARRAIDLFVYRIVREIGSLVAALGGLDALVFTGRNRRERRRDARRGHRPPRLGRPDDRRSGEPDKRAEDHLRGGSVGVGDPDQRGACHRAADAERAAGDIGPPRLVSPGGVLRASTLPHRSFDT